MDELTFTFNILSSELTQAKKMKLFKLAKKIVARRGDACGKESTWSGDIVYPQLVEFFTEYFGNVHPRVLAGRLANGAERDHGNIVHLVADDGVALCGAKPGRRSAGWVRPYGEQTNCEKCNQYHSEAI